MSIDEILYKRSRAELMDLMEKTARRYEKMGEEIRKGSKGYTPPTYYDEKRLERQVKQLKAEGFPIEEGPPPA